MSSHRFYPTERLKSRARIQSLFAQGQSLVQYPLRVVWELHVGQAAVLPAAAQVAFSVPKRRYRKAVARHLLRRRMQEAYRLRKADFLAQLSTHDAQVSLMILYIGKEALPYARVERAMDRALAKLLHKSNLA